MGIDIAIVHEDGKDADDIFTDYHSRTHIACAIEFVCGDCISVGMRFDCYALIASITDHWLCAKYCDEDGTWTVEELKTMARFLKRNVRDGHIPYDDDARKIKMFLEFLIKNRLCIFIW